MSAAGHGARCRSGLCLCARPSGRPAADPEALFRSSDPKLQVNKQAAYHIVKDLLEAGHWELADQYLTERYIQHNPNAASGRAGVVKFFTEVLKVKPKPIPERMATKSRFGRGRRRPGGRRPSCAR